MKYYNFQRGSFSFVYFANVEYIEVFVETVKGLEFSLQFMVFFSTPQIIFFFFRKRVKLTECWNSCLDCNKNNERIAIGREVYLAVWLKYFCGPFFLPWQCLKILVVIILGSSMYYCCFASLTFVDYNPSKSVKIKFTWLCNRYSVFTTLLIK